MLTQRKDRQDRLADEIAELRGEVKGLRRERDAATTSLDLADEVVELKTELEDLRISKGRLTEDNERKVREVEHKVGLERKRQEFEIEQARREADVTVREEALKEQEKRFQEHLKFNSERFDSQVTYLQKIVRQVLDRLPTVNVDRQIGGDDDGAE
jgi:hypothetical protein